MNLSILVTVLLLVFLALYRPWRPKPEAGLVLARPAIPDAGGSTYQKEAPNVVDWCGFGLSQSLESLLARPAASTHEDVPGKDLLRRLRGGVHLRLVAAQCFPCRWRFLLACLGGHGSDGVYRCLNQKSPSFPFAVRGVCRDRLAGLPALACSTPFPVPDSLHRRILFDAIGILIGIGGSCALRPPSSTSTAPNSFQIPPFDL